MSRLHILLAALFAGLFCACAPESGTVQEDAPEFKMIVRLWTHHHEDPELAAQLLDALRKYPGCADEVWFESKHVFASIEEHQASAEKMGRMADEMRKLGITPSIQIVTIGHPEGPGDDDGSAPRWKPVVGPDGAVAHKQFCPRDKDFLDYLEAVYELYAKECRPHGIWIDDDLRITFHSPAADICYCDECLAGFNREHGYSYTREALVKDMDNNVGNIRREWIRYSQEGLAEVAAAVARGAHKGCPETHMGLQHVNFHRSFLEGYDWNPIFDAFERETGLAPLSRPGNGFYRDYAPREMLTKGLDIARQIRRLNKNIVEIAPEIEACPHRVTGKSPQCACIETMYYLSMGATQMSYALICDACEPMELYADTYFKALQEWHAFAKEYADFNWGSQPGGLNPYISRDLDISSRNPGNGTRNWTSTWTGTHIYGMATLGIPFCPDGEYPAALMIDHAGMRAMEDAEILGLMKEHDLVINEVALENMHERGLDAALKRVEAPEGLENTPCYETAEGHRVAVISLNIEITSVQRQELLKAIDWASHSTMPALIESYAQAALVPRVDAEGHLRSVAILNCSISKQDSYTLRLRTGNPSLKSFTWKKNGCKDVKLKPVPDGDDVILTVPMLEGWNFGWIAVE